MKLGNSHGRLFYKYFFISRESSSPSRYRYQMYTVIRIKVGMQLYNLYRSNRKAVTCRILLLHKHTHTLGSDWFCTYDSAADQDKINIRLINDDYILVESSCTSLCFSASSTCFFIYFFIVFFFLLP
jgi:hypothetical protein